MVDGGLWAGGALTVDPNQTLEEIRALVEAIQADDAADDLPEKADELATLVQALDEWLSNRGFLPAAWEEPGKLHRARR